MPVLQNVGDRSVAGTVTTAAASVREDDEPSRAGRDAEVSSEGDAGEVQPHGSWRQSVGTCTHRISQLRLEDSARLTPSSRSRPTAVALSGVTFAPKVRAAGEISDDRRAKCDQPSARRDHKPVRWD